MGSGVAAVLEGARQAERQQALTYRSLAARAESAGNPDLAQRFHDLHADEQHHLSRLTARILELGEKPEPLADGTAAEIPLGEWEGPVREREAREVERYRGFVEGELDETTRALLREILDVEERHLAELGGKWTMA